jgi:hypothetical protein
MFSQNVRVFLLPSKGIAAMKPLKAEINRTRTIGVEHEFYLPVIGLTSRSRSEVQQSVADVLTANGIQSIARGYDHSPLPADTDVAVETDASVNGTQTYYGVNHYPIEIKTRVLTYDEYERIVPKMLEIVNYLGGRVNSSCGYHVHLGLPEIKQRPSIIRSLFNLFFRFEPVIRGSLISPSRRTNHYCGPMPVMPKLLHGCTTLESFRRSLGSWQKYYGLNFLPLWGEHPHIEIRFHQGSLDSDKSKHWLRFCMQMIEHAVTRNCQSTTERVPNSKVGINRLLSTCGFRQQHGIYESVSDELRETGRYLLLKRFRHFKNLEKQSRTSIPSGEDS